MIPPELQRLPRWVGWRPAVVDGVRRKVPLSPDTLRPARCSDPATWGPFALAWRSYAAGDVAGVSFALGAGYVGVDLDHCLTGDTLTPWAAGIVVHLATYTEVSPSGTGLHFVCRGTLPGPRRVSKTPGEAIEMYPELRFLAMTGHVYGPPLPIAERSEALATLYRAVFGPDPEPPPMATERAGLADTAILRMVAANPKYAALWRGDTAGYGSPSEADLALCSYLAWATGQDAARVARLFAGSVLARRTKWQDRPEYRAWTVARACRGQVAA